MAIDIDNPVALKKALEDIGQIVIQNVSDKILEKLQENIKKYVYEYEYFPNKSYYNGSKRPTFEFLDAWKWDQIKVSVKDITTELFYDYSGMGYDPDRWLHGSRIGGDARANLADILNKLVYLDTYTSSLMLSQITNLGANTPDRPFSKARGKYWDITIRELFDQQQITRWFDNELAAFGFMKFT